MALHGNHRWVEVAANVRSPMLSRHRKCERCMFEEVTVRHRKPVVIDRSGRVVGSGKDRPTCHPPMPKQEDTNAGS